VPRHVYREHAHGLGDSGAGKTSLFLCPIIEQLVMQGDCSVIVLDLKADTLELLGTLQAAAEAVRRERGVRMPLKWDRHENRPRLRYTAGQQSDAEYFGVSFPLSFVVFFAVFFLRWFPSKSWSPSKGELAQDGLLPCFLRHFATKLWAAETTARHAISGHRTRSR
jgi:hypothetical protein